MNFLPTFVFLSTFIFGLLFVIWNRGDWFNLILKFVFFFLFLFGIFQALQVSGFLIKV